MKIRAFSALRHDRKREIRVEMVPQREIAKVKLSIRNAENSQFFDAKMANWKDLSDKLKEMIVKKMDIVTRTKLKMCSKADKVLVESVPIHFKMIRVESDGDPVASRANIYFLIGELEIEKNGADLKISRNGKTRVKSAPNQQKALELALKYFNSIVFKGKVETDQFFVKNLNYPTTPFTSDSLINAKSVLTAFVDKDDCHKWLQHFSSDTEMLSIGFSDMFQGRIGGIEHIPVLMNAKNLRITGCPIDNDAIQYLNATTLNLKHSMIGKVGLKKLIKKWIDEDYPIEASFSADYPDITTLYQLVDGLDNFKKKYNMEGIKNAISIRLTSGKQMYLAEYDHFTHKELHGWIHY